MKNDLSGKCRLETSPLPLVHSGACWGWQFLAVLVLTVLPFRTHCFGLETDAMRAMVIVTGDEGRGSGFLVQMEGKVYLVTNSHVLRGNRNLKFKTLDNREVAVGAFEIADAADLVRAEAKEADAGTALKLAQNLVRHVKIGDPVSVAGNSEGQGVVRELAGKVNGIGPDRIEVDAPFVPGNSGSPIVLQSTGEVIGVATYYTLPPYFGDPNDPDPKPKRSPRSLNEVRRFGYRLDTVGEWLVGASPNGILEQGRKLRAIENLTSALGDLVNEGPADLADDGPQEILPGERAEGEPVLEVLRKHLEVFVGKYRNARTWDARKQESMAFYAMLTSVATSDLQDLHTEQFSGFFAQDFREQMQARNSVQAWLASEADKVAHATAPVSHGHPSWKKPLPPKLTLALHEDANLPPATRHSVAFAPESRPSDTANMFWCVGDPTNRIRQFALGNATSFTVETPVNGKYWVCIFRWDRRGKKTVGKPVLSNTVEFLVSDIPEPKSTPPAADAQPAPSVPAPPAAPSACEPESNLRRVQ